MPYGVIHWARRYDLLIALATLGRERALRERFLGLAHLEPGESVLDVGCGTGTLAIAAKRHVGATGTVHGIDASPEMIARARKKAKHAGADVAFETALAESLPFPDGRFDVVLSTVMLHHLPRAVRQQSLREMRRVLVPGGRALVVDFGKNTGNQRGLLAHLHRHGRVALGDLVSLQSEAGLSVVESGPVGIGTLVFVLGQNVTSDARETRAAPSLS
jgi:ubiquinone/menaquinone biosynthesis C-methylase UbiE